MSEENPFSNRTMIMNPDEFFGRNEQLETIFKRLVNLQSCDISGERKIGKSSLLYHIFLKMHTELGDDYEAVYIDMQDPKYHTVGGFLKYSLKELGSNSEVISSSNSLNEKLVAFTESIESLRKEKLPVLLIDECENMIKRQEFNNEFFETMRSLGNNGNLAYVTASLHSIKGLCMQGNFTSPFYNIFSDVPLGMFSTEETHEFLSAERNGFKFNEYEITFIEEIADNNPLHLQIACYHVFENRGKTWNEKKLTKVIKKEFNHYKDWWLRKHRMIYNSKKGILDFLTEIIKKKI